LVLGTSASQSQDELRWSYLIWREGIGLFLVVELLSPGTEDEDLGQTLRVIGKPPTKWQVYEQILRVNFYALYDRYSKQFRLFELRGGGYVELTIDGQGFWFEALQLGLGLWNGSYFGVAGQWLRWYDRSGNWVGTDQVDSNFVNALKNSLTNLPEQLSHSIACIRPLISRVWPQNNILLRHPQIHKATPKSTSAIFR
jgi:hypothetical protein